MRFSKRPAAGLLVLAGVLLVAGCGKEPPSPTAFQTNEIDRQLEGRIRIDGSSTVYKVSQAAAEEFARVATKIDISVKYAGTGGGFKSFVKGKLDLCDASRPIQESEMALCRQNGVEYIELPICFDALTVAVNVKNDWANDITTAELRKLWEPNATGKIMTWSQVRDGWPNEKITLFGAGTDSGTYEYFTEAIVGKKNASRSDYTASENDNDLLRGIEGDLHALGYIPYAYYEPRQSTLKALRIDWDQGELGPIEPSPATVVKGIYNPLSRPLFLYVNRKSAERPEVKAFIDFYLRNGKLLAEEVSYIPLPDSAYPVLTSRFNRLNVGTGFGGHSKVGHDIDELLKIELKL